ncbi:MAG: peptide-methionine (S)-S-oxide reductase MsrA [Patescibacteria group bacterium]
MARSSIAIFGGGCFWQVEEDFHHLDGILKTEVGYMGGDFKNPTCEDVCSGNTGHAEVVKITFDEKKLSFGTLLDKFFDSHDPTQKNMQGPDIGEQYRSVIFYTSEAQRKKAQEKIEDINNSEKYNKKIVTQIVPSKEFYLAEDYHQQYLHKRGMTSCRFTSSI